MYRLGLFGLLLILWACQTRPGGEGFAHRLERIETDLRELLHDKQGNSLPLLPPVRFQPELDANARLARDTIWVGQLQRPFQTDDDIASLFYHEYQHYLFERSSTFPVRRDSTGQIVQWKTGEWFTFQPSAYRIERSLLYFQDSVLPTYGELTESERAHHLAAMRQTVSQAQQLPFTYAPSNLSREEIAAYEAQLRGEAEGLYQLSSTARAEIKERLTQQKETLERRLDYEASHGLGPDGSTSGN
jgi:hypothetical protein